MFHTLRALAAVGSVDFAACRQHPDFRPDLEPLRRLCRSLHIVEPVARPDPKGPRSRREALERYVLSRRPTHVAHFPEQELAAEIEPLARAADLIWTVRLGLAEWIPGHRERMIVDLDDFESVKRAQVLAPPDHRPWRWLPWIDNWKLRRLEQTAPRRYARCVVCSEDQRAFFPAGLRRSVLVMPNGFAPRLLAHRRTAASTKTIVFVGMMDYAPNVDAAAWFVGEIFPSVLRRVPEARLLLVGHDTYHRARPLADGDRIMATGSVADVAPLVAQSTVSVAPIRVGSGTRVKILEALALGVPVVSTTLGAEGLDLAPGREILLADEAERFADEVVRLLTDGVARDALGEAGRAAVESAYSWDAIEQRLADDVRAWLAERP